MAASMNAGPAPAGKRRGRLRLGLLGRAWAWALVAAVALGLVNLWLVLTFMRELFLTLGMI